MQNRKTGELHWKLSGHFRLANNNLCFPPKCCYNQILSGKITENGVISAFCNDLNMVMKIILSMIMIGDFNAKSGTV